MTDSTGPGASGRQPPVDYIERTREQYSALGYPTYRWVEEQEPPAFARVDKPMHEWRVGLVASGGIYVQGQIAFHHRDDVSYREIDVETPIEKLRATHFAYDLTDARSDPNTVFPLETLRGLRDAGEIGDLGARAYTFMGGIYSVRMVRDTLAPALAERLVSDCVDVAIMVPV